MIKRTATLAIPIFVLLLATPALAQTAGHVIPWSGLAIFDASDPGAVPAAPQDEKIATSGGIQAQSTCTADCGSGGSVTCTGSSCSAVDRNCSVDQRGYCTGDGGTTYCPTACPRTCTVSTTCPDGFTQLSCTSTNNQCDGGAGLCYVWCDGTYQFCPGHEGEIFCSAL